MASPSHILLLVLAALAPLSPGAAPALRPAAASASSATDISSASNPLAGLPALPKVHHSYGMCRPGPTGVMPWLDCALPVDSTSALQVDFARITHAWAVDVAFNAGGHPAHTPAGEPIWDDAVVGETKETVLFTAVFQSRIRAFAKTGSGQTRQQNGTRRERFVSSDQRRRRTRRRSWRPSSCARRRTHRSASTTRRGRCGGGRTYVLDLGQAPICTARPASAATSATRRSQVREESKRPFCLRQ